jgi:hypothetical protein
MVKLAMALDAVVRIRLESREERVTERKAALAASGLGDEESAPEARRKRA